MSASSLALDSGAAGAMSLEGWCVLAMGALFGLFLFGVWWELRQSLRSISRRAWQRERAIVKRESEAAFVRELAREAASARMAALRAASAPRLQVLAGAERLERVEEAAPAAPHALGMESVGRILERLAQSAPVFEGSEDDAPDFAVAASAHEKAAYARPTLNMVRGGKAPGEEKAGEEASKVAARPRKSGAGRGRARDGVKSSSMGSSAIGSGALFASR